MKKLLTVLIAAALLTVPCLAESVDLSSLSDLELGRLFMSIDQTLHDRWNSDAAGIAERLYVALSADHPDALCPGFDGNSAIFFGDQHVTIYITDTTCSATVSPCAADDLSAAYDVLVLFTRAVMPEMTDFDSGALLRTITPTDSGLLFDSSGSRCVYHTAYGGIPYTITIRLDGDSYTVELAIG